MRTLPPPPITSQEPLGVWLEQLRQDSRRHNSMRGENQLVNGLIEETAGQGDFIYTDLPIKLFEIMQLSAGPSDSIRCKEVFYSETGARSLDAATTDISKPPKLRQFALSGQTVGGITYAFSDTNNRTRTYASLGGSSNVPIADVIYPAYAVGDVIIAAKVTTGAHLINDANTPLLEWVDLNADGREWWLPEQVWQVCVLDNNGNPTTKKAVLRGSATF